MFPLRLYILLQKRSDWYASRWVESKKNKVEGKLSQTRRVNKWFSFERHEEKLW